MILAPWGPLITNLNNALTITLSGLFVVVIFAQNFLLSQPY